MRKNSLTPNKGLSLSQAQSISNLCNQRAKEIQANLSGINNYSKTIESPTTGGGSKTLTIVVGKELPANVVDLLIEKANLHACQAFLMENIKAKDAMLKAAKIETVDISGIEEPQRPKLVSPLVNQLPEVKEEWGWEQLTASEISEFTEAEAYAAHIGQFIHQDGILDRLRTELPRISPVEWMEVVKDVKTPIEVKTHHTPEQLLEVHEKLASLHREFEQRTNYFKAKVKNLVTAENARIAKVNADAQAEAENTNNQLNSSYDTAFKAYSEKVKSLRNEFEKTRHANIASIASMRIDVDPRFQKVVDTFLAQLSDKQE